MSEQELTQFERELYKSAEPIRKVMAKAFASDNIHSRLQVNSCMGKPKVQVDIVDPQTLDDDYDASNMTASEREEMAYHLITGAILYYSDQGPTEARTVARMAVNQMQRHGLFGEEVQHGAS